MQERARCVSFTNTTSDWRVREALFDSPAKLPFPSARARRRSLTGRGRSQEKIASDPRDFLPANFPNHPWKTDPGDLRASQEGEYQPQHRLNPSRAPKRKRAPTRSPAPSLHPARFPLTKLARFAKAEQARVWTGGEGRKVARPYYLRMLSLRPQTKSLRSVRPHPTATRGRKSREVKAL